VEELLAACADLPVDTFSPGSVLVEEGAPPGRMLVLVSGAVQVERDGVPIARTDTPGAAFGEMSAVLDHPATATVRATTEVQARVVDDPVAFLLERPAAALAVLRMTAGRLDGLTQYLGDVKAQLAGTDGHLGMLGQILDTLVHHDRVATRPGSARDPEDDHSG
jgi:CRP-like cAMP-binding protein